MKINKMLSSISLVAIAANVLMAGGDITPVEPVVPNVVVSNGWEYSAIINLWAAGIRGETADGADIDLSFSDIVDNLDFTFMGTFGAQKGKWGVLADVVYMNLSDDINAPLPDDVITITNIEMKNWIVTPMVTYRVVEEDQLSLDVLAGARYLYLKTTLKTDRPASRSASGSVWDGIVGVRGKYDLNEKWYMPFRLDVGTGDTDMTWQAFAGVGYKYENFDLIAGYRYLEWEFDESDTGGKIFNDLTVDGPIISFKFDF